MNAQSTPAVQPTKNKGVFGPNGQLITPDDFASDLVVTMPYNKVSVGGMAGDGKSRTSAEIMAGIYNLLKKRGLLLTDAPLLCIDTEDAAQFLVEFFKEQGVPVKAKQTKSLADVQTAFDLASAGHYFGVYIDSATHIYKDFIENWAKKNLKSGEKMEMRHYGITNPLWEKEFGQRMVAAKCHIVFTGRGTAAYEMVENDETHKKEMQKTGVKMQISKDAPFDPNLVIWMSSQQRAGKGGKPIVWREAFILKDRSGTIDGKTFGNEKAKGPSFKDFEPHFTYLLRNVTPGAKIAGQTTSSESVIPDVQERDPEADEKKVALDQIQSLLTAVAPGRSDVEKKLKCDILERVYNERSWEAIKKFSAATIKSGIEPMKTEVENIRKAIAASQGDPA
jgi:hypothetical protein